MIRKTILALSLAGMAAVGANAKPSDIKPVEEKNLLSGKQSIDPAMGYIFLHGPFRQSGVFLKEPDAEDIKEYTEEWETQFQKAQEKHVKRMKSWEQNVKVAKRTNKKPPEQPVEPTRENFSIGYLETRNTVSFGPQFIFNKAKGEEKYFSYMHQLPPGTYIYHGPMFFNPQAGYTGTCYCMGSVKLDVKPGVITNLGNFLLAAPQSSMQDEAPSRPVSAAVGLFTQQINSGAAAGDIDFTLPESLKDKPSVAAEFRAAGKMNNYFGGMVSRMPPIPGILEYKRDTVIDARGLTEAKSAKEIAREKAEATQAEEITDDLVIPEEAVEGPEGTTMDDDPAVMK